MSASSIKSKSTKSSQTRSHRLVVPSFWRHTTSAIKPRHKKQTCGNSLPGAQSTQKDYPTHDAPVNDSHRDGARERQSNSLTTVNALFKPLPRPPDSILRPMRQSSHFNISPTISTLGKAIDPSFLSNLEQQVLQSVQLLSEPPTTDPNALVQLGVDCFWMSRRDAGMLERINNLTEHLTPSAKGALLTDLNLLLKAPFKYPLQQVLRHGLQVIEIKPPGPHVGDNSSLIEMYSDIDRSTQHLLPAPLRIRKEGYGHLEEQTSREDDQIDVTAKQPGSISRARAGLLNSHHEHDTPGNDSVIPFPPKQACLGDLPVGEELKQPGSVRNARKKVFENPRPAPKPPVSIARPHGRGQSKPVEPPTAPGSVGRARIAAENAQAMNTATSADEQAVHTLDASEDQPKQLGSVARARIAAQNALLAGAPKTSRDSSGNVRPGQAVTGSSSPTLKQSSSGDSAFPDRLSSLPLRPVEERRQNFKAGLSPISGHVKAASTNVIVGIRKDKIPTAIKTGRTRYRDKEPYALSFDSDSELEISPLSPQDLLTGAPLFDPARVTLEQGPKGGDPIEKPPLPAKDAHNFKSHAAVHTAHEQGAEDPTISKTAPAHPDALCPDSYSNSSTKPVFDIHKAVSPFDKFRLRGSADSNEHNDAGAGPAQTIRRRVSTLLGKGTVLNDDERPPKALWWLADGRTGGLREVPTAGELRERKKVEEANQEIVGYIGTVFGVRAIRRLPMKLTEAEADASDEKVPETEQDDEKKSDGEKPS